MDDDEIRICGEALDNYRDRKEIMDRLRTGGNLSLEDLETLDAALSEYLYDVRDLQSRVRLRLSDLD